MMSRDSLHRSLGLVMIAAYKLTKAAVLLVGGGVVLRLKPNDLLESVIRLAARFRFDPDDLLIHATIARLSGLSERRLEAIGAGIVLYGLLYGVEGVGLLFQKRWAEYLVVITTSLLIPLELYEVFRKAGALRILVLVLNLLIVVYLIGAIPVDVERHRDRQRAGTGPPDRSHEHDS